MAPKILETNPPPIFSTISLQTKLTPTTDIFFFLSIKFGFFVYFFSIRVKKKFCNMQYYIYIYIYIYKITNYKRYDNFPFCPKNYKLKFNKIFTE